MFDGFYDSASIDGMDNTGLVGNALYFIKADFGDATRAGKPTLAINGEAQYIQSMLFSDFQGKIVFPESSFFHHVEL